MPLRIAIADDHGLVRQGMRSLLESHPDLVVAVEVDHADALAPALAGTPVDVVLLDLQMERSTLVDIEALARTSKVIVVTVSERTEDALAALRAGARGLVFKRFAIETLLEAIDAVQRGQTWTPPEVQARLSANLRSAAAVPLTTREREIVRHVALGLRNAEVARRLAVTEVTVKTHLNNVFRKLAIRDRVELTRYAIRVGLVSADELSS